MILNGIIRQIDCQPEDVRSIKDRRIADRGQLSAPALVSASFTLTLARRSFII